MIFCGVSDVGKIRKDNEDSYYIKAYDDNHMLAIVADGMGGHIGGKQASVLAVESIAGYFDSNISKIVGYTPRKIKQVLLDCVKEANKSVYNFSGENPELFGMGTTIVVCYISDNKVYAVSAGDSRLYIINDSIKQITRDHSLINELLEMGMISPGQAKNHPKRNIITKAVGSEVSIEPDIYMEKIDIDDTILLCTDGLTNMIDNEKITEIVKSDTNLSTCANSLVEEAKKNGGNDNITVIIIRQDKGGEAL